jgi:hypothetical protein
MFNEILLDRPQQTMLGILVEAERNLPRYQREEFVFFEMLGGASITHSGLPNGKSEANVIDLKILEREGLIIITNIFKHGWAFGVTPAGLKYYESMILREKQPVRAIEREITKYLDSNEFVKKYPKAFEKWQSADTLLWSGGSERNLTTLGHLCREAIQEFMSSIIAKYNLLKDEPEKDKTVSRLRIVINSRKNFLGDSEKQFLDALLSYWGTISDLIQKQEHDSQKEGDPLTWEDGRRVVFQTAIVMFEVDRSLSRNLP